MNKCANQRRSSSDIVKRSNTPAIRLMMNTSIMKISVGMMKTIIARVKNTTLVLAHQSETSVSAKMAASEMLCCASSGGG